MQVEVGIALQIVTALLVTGAVYGSLRAELRRMRSDLNRLEKATKRAHKRLDSIGTFGTRRNDA